MSRSLNRATLIGNLGADPEIRVTASGSRVAHFSLATSRSWKDADGTPHERTEWHRAVVWGARVEVVEHYLKKGERVYVDGEIQYRSYEDPEGTTRYVTEINVRELLLLGGRDGSGGVGPEHEPAPAGRETRARKGRAAAPAMARAGAFGDDDLPF